MLFVVWVSVGVAIAALAVWQIASRRYALPCPVWLAWLVELDNPFARENRAATIIGHLALQSGMQVLDAGCGPGRLSLPIAQKVLPGGQVVAIDLQAGMLDRTRAKAEAAGTTNIQFLRGALGQGHLPAERFDRAVMVTVLGEIPDRAAAMRELFAALKPGGILSVTETLFDPHYVSRSSALELGVAAGFRRRALFGNALAYTLHLERPAMAEVGED